MRIGASTFIWVSPFSSDTLDLIDKVKAFGFDLIEICVEDPDTIDTAVIGRALKGGGTWRHRLRRLWTEPGHEFG